MYDECRKDQILSCPFGLMEEFLGKPNKTFNRHSVQLVVLTQWEVQFCRWCWILFHIIPSKSMLIILLVLKIHEAHARCPFS